MLTITDLHDHQSVARRFANDTPYSALMMGLGLGKTISALTSARDQLALGEVNRVLVVAPLRVANTVWHKEAAEWLHTSGLTVNICTGSARQRRVGLKRDAQIYVINIENIVWMIKTYNKKWIWDMLILDESSAYKSESSKRFAAVRRLCSDVPSKGWKNPVKRMVQLTATPATNGLLGLWSQVFLLDGGKRLGKSFRQYRIRFFDEYVPEGKDGKKNYHSVKYRPVPGAKEKIFESLKDICLVMRSEDYLDVAEPIYNTIEVDMPDDCRADYKRMQREFVLEYENGDEIVAPNSGALSNKLMQFSNGAVYTGDTPETPIPNRPFRIVHDAKIDALVELCEAAEGSQPLLVVYWFKSDLKRIRKAIPGARVMDKKGVIVDEWNRGEIDVLLIHPQSAGHGLNMQHGGSTMIFFSLLWSLELYLQVIGRLYRTGQKNGVVINHITTRDSMDQKIFKALHSNAETQSEMMDYLKTIL